MGHRVVVVRSDVGHPSGAGEEGGGCGEGAAGSGLAKARSTKFNAREAARPVGRWPDTAEMIAELRRPRAGTLAFAAETQAELRDHFFPHLAFGDLDCYQWLVVPVQHGLGMLCRLRRLWRTRGILPS